MENSKIAWTDHTFNPWVGCTKVSPGCLHCYAKTRDDRHLHGTDSHWGPGAPRQITSDAYWRQPLGGTGTLPPRESVGVCFAPVLLTGQTLRHRLVP